MKTFTKILQNFFVLNAKFTKVHRYRWQFSPGPVVDYELMICLKCVDSALFSHVFVDFRHSLFIAYRIFHEIGKIRLVVSLTFFKLSRITILV